MIDSITISLPFEAVTLPSLEGERVTTSAWGKSVSGSYGNLLVRRFNDRVSITGSLQKFHQGTNAVNATFGDDIEAINHLSDSFSFDPLEARLRRLDIGANVSLTHPAKAYLPLLGTAQYYARRTDRNSVYYQNSLRTLIAYDKSKEAHISGNILRFETRYKSPSRTAKKVLSLADLRAEETYNLFFDRWKNEYRAIQKLNTLLPLEDMAPKDIFDSLAAIGLGQIGAEAIEAHIKSSQRSGKIDKYKARRFRAKIKQLSTSNRLSKPSELIEELNERILNHAA